MHEAQQCSHIVISAGRQDELLDDEQGVFPTLPVLHDVVNATSAAKLPEQSWERERKKWQKLSLCTFLTEHNDTRPGYNEYAV